jgi:hypothetical protein
VVSIRTVHAHLRSIHRKLDVHNRSAAARYALEHGLATWAPDAQGWAQQLGTPADVAHLGPPYRQVMKLNSHAPQSMFAATRACAEQRARETAAAAPSPARGVFRRLATRLALSVS